MMTIKRRGYRVDSTNGGNKEKVVIGWTASMMTIKRRGYRVDNTL